MCWVSLHRPEILYFVSFCKTFILLFRHRHLLLFLHLLVHSSPSFLVWVTDIKCHKHSSGLWIQKKKNSSIAVLYLFLPQTSEPKFENPDFVAFVSLGRRGVTEEGALCNFRRLVLFFQLFCSSDSCSY